MSLKEHGTDKNYRYVWDGSGPIVHLSIIRGANSQLESLSPLTYSQEYKNRAVIATPVTGGVGTRSSTPSSMKLLQHSHGHQGYKHFNFRQLTYNSNTKWSQSKSYSWVGLAPLFRQQCAPICYQHI